MKDGYFFLHHSPVARSSGASAVAAAAYNANQDLEHKQQRHGELDIAFRQTLNKGIVDDALRQALNESFVTPVSYEESILLEAGQITPSLRQSCTAQGVEISGRCHVAQHSEGYTLWDPDQKLRYVVRRGDDGWALYQQHGIALSDHVTVEKKNRREWVIRDSDHHYTIKEFELKEKDAETGKRKTIKRGLDLYANKWHRYSGKGDVQESWIELPRHAPPEMKEMAAQPNPTPELRSALWNAAEAVTVSRNGIAAYKYEVALLRDLSFEQNKQALRAFVQKNFTSRGHVADIAIHEVEASDRRANLHAHILVSAHSITKEGEFSRTKESAWWSHPARLREWRQSWQDTLNDCCEEYGIAVRVDHRSYAERGIDKVPGVHLGPQQHHMEKKGIETRKGEHNRDIKQDNAVRAVTSHFDGTPEAHLAAETDHEKQQQARHLRRGHPDIEALPESQLDALHQANLRTVMAGRMRQSVRSAAETIHRVRRYSQAVMGRAKEWASTAFDRYAVSTMRRMASQYQRERGGPER